MSSGTNDTTTLKITYEILQDTSADDRAQFKANILKRLEARKQDVNVVQLKCTLTEVLPPRWSIIPFRKEKIAAIQTVWRRDPLQSDLLAPTSMISRIGAYYVDEVFPVKYDRTWPLEQQTPGVCLLTLFQKRKDLSHEEYLSRWFGNHTPFSLKVHPLWHYSRNEVTGLWQDDSYPYDGIVEEHTRTRSELLNPIKFFGGPVKMVPNMIAEYFDVKAFLNYKSISPYLAAEYYLKSSDH